MGYLNISWRTKGQKLLKKHLAYLRCPQTGQKLKQSNRKLLGKSHIYYISRSGVANLMPNKSERNDEIQQNHYNKNLVDAYIKNLTYPHTRVYFRYLDNELRKIIGKKKLGKTVDLCCGHGEAQKIFKKEITLGYGVDVSEKMLFYAKKIHQNKKFEYLQASGLNLPFPANTFDSVICLGGIHHVPNRKLLFNEISRVLKKGGVLVFREPVDDFFLWRALRKIIYLVSPKLDLSTEQPVRRNRMIPELAQSGLQIQNWETKGFIGCALVMNSDILIFNRFLRFVPGIKVVVNKLVHFDEKLSKTKLLKGKGIQVLGLAKKD